MQANSTPSSSGLRSMFCVGLLCLIVLTPSRLNLAQPTICPDDPDFIPTVYAYGDDPSQEVTAALNEFGPSSIGITTTINLRNAEHIGWGTYAAEIGTPVTLDFGFIYHGGIETPSPGLLNIRYYVFLNEQILPLGDGSFTHWDMQLTAGQINILSVEIPTLADGVYDLVLAGIPNFDNPPAGIAGTSEPGNMSMFRRRVSLVVGDGQPTEAAPSSQILPALTFFTEARMAELSRMGTRPHTLLPTLTEEPYWWVWPDIAHEVTVGSEYTFNLLTHYQNYRIQDERYDNGARMRFALIGFQNNTLLNLGDTSSTLYREITNVTERAAIPIALVAPENPGRYDLVFFKIDYPGVPLCRLTTRVFPGVEGIRMSIEAVPQAD